MDYSSLGMASEAVDLERRIECESPEKIIWAVNAVSPGLPKGILKRLHDLKWLFWQEYGDDGLYLRFNNRTVGEILREYSDIGDQKPVETGEKDGVRYQLFDSVPPSNSNAVAE